MTGKPYSISYVSVMTFDILYHTADKYHIYVDEYVSNPIITYFNSP